ncbi:histidinol dehydrogenase [Kocuria sp.]|uniref:histidinol dehydrogenase n=1 Tax=Kocuria sp. TaxID=1871328 RepID=UPI0026DEC406|nr:histidinol dehydrogenase [Kocuria sp.]MDO5618439.1 histidinol dehydrogenase [Kocuria sp.]
MRTVDLRGRELTWAQLRAAVPRQTPQSLGQAEETVRGIINHVRTDGAEALREYAARFDRVEQDRLRVDPAAIRAAVDQLDPKVRHGLESAIERCRTFAAAQRPADAHVEVAPGARLVHRWTPVARVGLYVPGGLAVYPSSVVMNVVPAQAAGVDSVVLCTPPQAEFGGLPHPTILAAAGLLGVDEVWAIGGAQALAAMAYGLTDSDHGDTLEAVQTITGPGNIFVATAKRLLRSMVGVDAEAGTTEIAVIADHTADPVFVAADLMSQAEHDPDAGSVLITHDPQMAQRVAEAIAQMAPQARHAERIKTALEGPQSGVILTDDLAASIQAADAYAAEHLEIHTEHPRDVAARIRNAGAIFVGPYSPVPLGDYAAGSNHVLPTGGSAVYAQGLCTTSFMKAVQVIEYTQEALGELEDDIVALAEEENLPNHGVAVALRGQRTVNVPGGEA